ncbi:S53 family peptidase [Calidifontibacter terrae]
MKRSQLTVAAVTITTALGVVAAGSATAAPADSQQVTLTNSVARTKLPTISPAADNTGLGLVLSLPLRNQALADRMLAAGQVITPAQYQQMFGVSKAQLNKVAAWARSQGFTVVSSDSAAGTVTVKGTVKNANKSMGVQMQKAGKGVRPAKAPKIPAALGVTGISGLDTTLVAQSNPPTRQLTSPARATSKNASSGAATRTTNFNNVQPNATTYLSNYCADPWGSDLAVASTGKKWPTESNTPCPYTPQQIVGAYGMAGAKTATPSLGILLWGDDTAALSNVNNLATATKSAPMASTKYSKLVDAKRPGTSCDFSPLEQNMDIQASHAIAPSASIRYYGAASCSATDIASMLSRAVSEHKVTTLSMSFGIPDEQGWDAATRGLYERSFTQAGLTGMSLFASTGDHGTNKILNNGKAAVNYPASSAKLTAVGGTSVGLTSTNGRAFTAGWENSWFKQPKKTTTAGITNITSLTNPQSDFALWGAGGGSSKVFTKPSWQAGIAGTGRALPDIAALADVYTGMELYVSGGLTGAGGTSLSSPLVAAMVGSSKALTKRTIGNAAPFFYKLQKANPGAVKDVNYANKTGAAVGSDDAGNTYLLGFDSNPEGVLVSKAGWDNVTGLGEPMGQGFLTGFGG